MLVYLLHFEKPFAHARHYIGSTPDHGLARRMTEHTTGQGAKLTAAVARAGIPMTLARLWYSPDRRLERKLKARRKSADLCPICSRGETGNPVLTGVPYTAAVGSWKPSNWDGG